MDKSKFTPTEQMLLLRDMTARFGVWHEAQTLQVRLMPLAVDPGLTHSEAKIDIDGKTITYAWERPAQAKFDKGYQKRLRGLADAVALYFGPDWRLKILLNGILLPIPPKTQEQSPKKGKRVGKRSKGNSKRRRSGSRR